MIRVKDREARLRFSRWLREQRTKRGYTGPKALARDYLGASWSSLSSYELARRLPNREAAEGLGDFFGDPHGALKAAGFAV